MNTRDAAHAAGVTYRQVDHWLRCGLGTDPRSGQGSVRTFTADDVRVIRFLGDLSRIAANNQHVSPTWIDDMRRVGAQVVDNPAILDRPYVFVAFDGTVTEHPAYGWVIAQGDNQ